MVDPAAEAVIRRVSDDCARIGVKADPKDIAAQVARCYEEALASLAADYPKALGPDHVPIGG